LILLCSVFVLFSAEDACELVQMVEAPAAAGVAGLSGWGSFCYG